MVASWRLATAMLLPHQHSHRDAELAMSAWRESALERAPSSDQPRPSELDGVIEQLAEATERQPQLARATSDAGIRLVQWNPHYQCFTSSLDCAAGASRALTALLTEAPRPDFVNVVEMESAYVPPAPYATIGAFASCGDDWDTLIWDASRWTLLSNATGCMHERRSFAVGAFRSIEDPTFALTVVGAHYPQTRTAARAYAKGTAALKAALQEQPAAAVVLLADTNVESPEAAAARPAHHGVNRTNAQLAVDLGIWPRGGAEPPAAPLFEACCYDDGFQWQGDRIAANFGRAGDSRLLFDPVPPWAAFDGSQFHKAVTLTLHRV